MSKKVVHLIAGLGKGGAETMLYQILKYRSESAPEYKVITMGLSHYYEDRIRDIGIEVVELKIKRRPIKSLLRLRRHLKGADTLCCWMYASNLIGYLCGRRKVRKLIWCVRHSDLGKENNSRNTRVCNQLCKMVSGRVDVIAYNGMRARENHELAGYAPRNGIVLENGLDTDEYRFDQAFRDEIRGNMGIPPNWAVVLSVGRNAPIKDLSTFIRAITLIRKKNEKVIGIMCGTGVEESDCQLKGLCGNLGLVINRDIYLLGFRDDVNRLMSAADIYVLHSAGEAFPNSLLQAMSCGLLCVSTDVGDAKRVLKDEEYIVDSGDYAGIVEKVSKLIGMDAGQSYDMRVNNRKIVENHYGIRQIVKDYERIFYLNSYE